MDVLRSARSDATEEGERDEVTEDGAGHDPEEDPRVVGHDAQHQHVAQAHLQHVEGRLGAVHQPAGREGEETETPSLPEKWGAAYASGGGANSELLWSHTLHTLSTSKKTASSRTNTTDSTIPGRGDDLDTESPCTLQKSKSSVTLLDTPNQLHTGEVYLEA
ncbi:hypothetical protein EYF80_047958 [Liparis tanakae]|uniref:Uncharacterized protein n=1 Tax=Liparis tanakae TaxID=230148 RepID=A0A4Z2FLF4_9TELE|nr:hypothetical protein EYF80_047958 [Liparis tanakae]